MSEKKPKKKRRGLRRFLIAVCVLGVAGVATLAAVLASFGFYDDAKLHSDPQSTLLYDAADAPTLSIHGRQNRVSVPLEAMPRDLLHAFIAAEDLRFYRHMGFDLIRIAGALWADIRTGSLSQGASTITQQLVKSTHLTPDKNFLRKLNEAYFAFQIEQDYTKDEILAMYMNHVYLGNAAYGVQAAARAYFGVDVGDLTLVQCASLAAILKAPTNYAPHIEPDNNKERRDGILATMLEEGFISQEEAAEALAATLTVRKEPEDLAHGWFSDAALEEAQALLGIPYEELLSGGYRIYTTLDAPLQAACEALYADAANFPEDAPDGTPVQAALVVCEPRTGEIRTLIGGRDYTARRILNRATQSRRQPGSTLKPFAVYAPAIERFGFSTVTPLDDSPADFDGYAPNNFGGNFNGWIPLRSALARSLNVPAVRVLDHIGVAAGREFAGLFGVNLTDDDAYLPLALGSLSAGVTPLELCGAYAALGNGGLYQKPHLVRRIESFSGEVLYTYQEEPRRAVSAQTAYLLTDVLSSAATWGTAAKLGQRGYSVAGKTGTVGFEGETNRDAWTAAYTPECAIVVWMGFDQTDAAHAMGHGVTGGALPAALAARVLPLVQEGDVPFAVPGNIEAVRLDKRALEEQHLALLVPDWVPEDYAAREVFAAGTAPARWSAFWVLPDPPADLTATRDANLAPSITFTVLQDFARYRLYRAFDGEEPIEIAAFQGVAGERVAYIDPDAREGGQYGYFVVPEHALAADAGVTAFGKETQRAFVNIPILPFELPSSMDELFTPKPTAPEAIQTPVSIPETTVTPKPTLPPLFFFP